jgi:hypothetical protein
VTSHLTKRWPEPQTAAAGDPFDLTRLTTAFADAEFRLIAAVPQLVTTDDEQARAFVRGWRALFETTNSDESSKRAYFSRRNGE